MIHLFLFLIVCAPPLPGLTQCLPPGRSLWCLASCSWALTNKVVHPVAHHVGGLGGTVEPEVFGHSLLLLGWLAHLLQGTSNKKKTRMALVFILTGRNIRPSICHPSIHPANPSCLGAARRGDTLHKLPVHCTATRGEKRLLTLTYTPVANLALPLVKPMWTTLGCVQDAGNQDRTESTHTLPCWSL